MTTTPERPHPLGPPAGVGAPDLLLWATLLLMGVAVLLSCLTLILCAISLVLP